MQEKNNEKKITWRNWLIRKLLVNETSKEDILNFIAKDEDNKTDIDHQEFEDIDEKKIN